MQKIYQKTAAIAFSAIVGVGTITAPTQATTLTWGLNFFDDAGKPVGSGEFSYDDEVLTFVPTIPPLPAPGGFEVNNALTRFSATVLGAEWNLSDRPRITWWQPTSTKSLGQKVVTRYGMAIADTWFFGDDLGLRQFLLQGGKQDSGDWGGSWHQAIPGFMPSLSSGSWSAFPSSAAVPEPSTILGVTLIGVGVWLRKRLPYKP